MELISEKSKRKDESQTSDIPDDGKSHKTWVSAAAGTTRKLCVRGGHHISGLVCVGKVSSRCRVSGDPSLIFAPLSAAFLPMLCRQTHSYTQGLPVSVGIAQLPQNCQCLSQRWRKATVNDTTRCLEDMRNNSKAGLLRERIWQTSVSYRVT